MLLALWCAAFAVGIAGSALLSIGAPAGVFAGAVIGAVGLALLIRQGWRATGGGALWLALGLAQGAAARSPVQLSAAAGRASAGETPVLMTARVIHGPEASARGGARLTLQLETIGAEAAPERLSLSVISGWPDFGPGERVRFSARLRALRGLCNPGLPDPTLAFRSAGIDLLAGVADAGAIQRLPPSSSSSWPSSWSSSWLAGPRGLAFRARRAMRAAIDRAVPDPQGAFLRTAVLGDRRGVDETVESGFRAAGATHVLSVSGLHLAALAVIVLMAVRALAGLVPALPLYIDPRAVAALVTLPVVGFFTLLTGEAVATERSALMIAVALAALLVNRPVSPPATLGAAALALLLGSPLLLFDVSLQLSFASVAGIALLARSLGPGARGGGGRARRAGRWLWRFGAATLSAIAATAPLSAHYFGEIAPAAPLGNLMLVPLVEMVVVPFGLAGAGLGALSARAGWLPLRVAGGAARLALVIAAAFRDHAPVWLCRTPNALETAALVAAGLLALGALPAGRAGRAKKYRLAGAICALAIGAGSLLAREIGRRIDPSLRVTFLDVGQGDAALIEAPGGHAILIDGGGSFDGSFDPGERVVEPLLRARGIGHLDLVALSHPHPDHLNGLLRVLERFSVGALWTSGDDGHNPEYRRLLATAQRRGVPLPVPCALRLGRLQVTPLGPWLDDRIGAPAGLSVNDASLVLRADFAGRAVLFPGDLEAAGEGELAGRAALGDRIAADVLKVPHHGSRTSSTPELLDAVAPSLAVISLGWQNRFHFPSAEVMSRYAARGARVLRTDRDGAVTVGINPAGRLAVDCARGCP